MGRVRVRERWDGVAGTVCCVLINQVPGCLRGMGWCRGLRRGGDVRKRYGCLAGIRVCGGGARERCSGQSSCGSCGTDENRSDFGPEIGLAFTNLSRSLVRREGRQNNFLPVLSLVSRGKKSPSYLPHNSPSLHYNVASLLNYMGGGGGAKLGGGAKFGMPIGGCGGCGGPPCPGGTYPGGPW